MDALTTWSVPDYVGPLVHTSRVTSLAAVSAAEWDSLAEHAELYQSYAYLRWAEESFGLPTTYVLARDGNWALVGAVATYLMRDVPERMITWYDPVRMFLTPYVDTTGAAEQWYPVLLVGGCSGYHSEMLFSASLDEAARQEVARALLAECRALAEAEQARSIAYMYAPKKACEDFCEALDAPAHLIVTSAEAVIDLDTGGQGFEDYLARFPSARRSKLRKEVQAFAGGGGRVSECSLRDVLDEVAPLLAAHQRKYGDTVTDEQIWRILALQEKYLGAKSKVFVDQRQGGIHGFTLCYSHGKTIYSRAAGFAPQHCAPYSYFNLAIYAPVQYALAHELTACALGLGSYQGKVLRGAELRALWSVVAPLEQLEPRWAQVLGRPSPQALDAGCA